MCRVTKTILLCCAINFIALSATAGEVSQLKNTPNNIAKRLNREQLSWIAKEQSFPTAVDSLEPGKLDVDGAEIGIVFLRGDGGDPKGLQADDTALMYIQGRSGEGRTYLNGREVEIHPAVKESVRQIATQQFRVPASVPRISELPAMAQAAVTRFAEGRVIPRLMFARVTSREDTARVSDKRVSEVLAMEGSARAAHPSNMVDLVRKAMLMFGLKSDVCDKSDDARCNRPGVREAFAQIKQEEALQLPAAIH
jgi:hypothetical protein